MLTVWEDLVLVELFQNVRVTMFLDFTANACKGNWSGFFVLSVLEDCSYLAVFQSLGMVSAFKLF